MATTLEPVAVDTGLPTLTNDEVLRYSRHLILPEVGLEGQRKLKAAKVLLVGAGGLGSPSALYLAAAGVGTIGIVDFDTVDVTNLQRQVLHGTSGIGTPKLESAKTRLHDLNPHVDVRTYNTPLTSANALDIIADYDIVVDGTDNFQTRYLTNDACILLGKPNVYGSIFRFDGQASVFCAPDGPCYRCLFREPPPPGVVPSCAEGGVLGVLPGIVGTIQATEAIKLILGIGDPLIGRLLLIDAFSMTFRQVKLRKDPTCPACGTHEIKELQDYDRFCGIVPPTAAAPSAGVAEITPAELDARRRGGADILVLDVREPHEWQIARIPDTQLIPLGNVGEAIPSLPRDRDIVVHCKGGARSAKAVRQLLDAGFTRVHNLAGGIGRWSDEVDPSVPKY